MGVLVQLNFGRREDLRIDGVPVGKELADYKPRGTQPSSSIMIIVATDLSLTSRQLWKVAKRAVLGIARTGSHGGVTSGDFVIAFSTSQKDVEPLREKALKERSKRLGRTSLKKPQLEESYLNPVYRATVEATEEAILNALFKAETMVGRDYHTRVAIPLDYVKEIMVKYHRI